ncbi:MAG: diguanylate cyclase, partial [Nitrospirota bacterium]|nr:diguanylate cyclase [Nitrospirota bacterium]
MIKELMVNVLEYLGKKSRPFLIVLGFVLVAFIGVIRYLTGPEFAFSLFFLLPIFLGTWFAGRWAGILLAIASALTWLTADLMMAPHYSHPGIPYVNETLRLSVFLIVVVILSTLKVVLEREKMFARKDFLTGIANRQAFFEFAGIEINRCRRHEYPLTIAYIDCDNFKVINDRFGHQTGDNLLCSVANTLQKSIRVTDIVARLGGDEFAILLPETGYEPAEVVIRKIQKALLDVMQKNRWPIT